MESGRTVLTAAVTKAATRGDRFNRRKAGYLGLGGFNRNHWDEAGVFERVLAFTDSRNDRMQGP